jgi:hypothetical protein
MTIESFLNTVGQIDVWVLVAIFLAPPVLVLIMSLLHGRGKGGDSPWKYIYSLFVYMVCVPGVFSCVLTGYSMFFMRQNMLQANLFIYFFPILCMIVTLVLVKKNVPLVQLPWFDRLYALIVLIAVSFVIALAIQKLRIWILFGGSIGTLVIIAIFCFALLKWGSYMLFRSKGAPERKPQSYSNFEAKPKKNVKTGKDELKKLKKKLGISK